MQSGVRCDRRRTFISTKLFAAKLRVAEGAVGDEKADHRRAGCATPRESARVNRKEHSGPEEELSQSKSLGHWMRNRRSRERSKSRASLIEGRRLGPGKASSRHGGGVESVLAGPAESVGTCTAKRHATGIHEVRDGGVRGSVGIVHGFGPKRPHSAKSIRRSDSRSVVKRSNLRSRWAASHRAHAQPLQHEAIVREAADWGRWAGKRQGTGAR